MQKFIVLKKHQKEYLKDLGKDVSLFTAGIFFGPIIDGAQLVMKHSKKIREMKGRK